MHVEVVIDEQHEATMGLVLRAKNAQFINPKVFAEKVVAADKVVSL